MKRSAVLAAALILTGGTAWGANPFSDVAPSDWAYQAVADLSDQGIVEGYPDGTFRGTASITRYEMAQITARLMAKEDQYSAEERAVIDQLAAEYADELDSLGVRVSNLEKKVGNISWAGDARFRYTSKGNKADESWAGRVRIMMKGQVNESTTVNARLSSDNVNLKSDSGADVGMEHLNVRHDFGSWDVTLGRYGLTFGNQSGWLFGSIWSFDGAQASAHFGPVDLAVGYGQFNPVKSSDKTIGGRDTFYAKAEAKLPVLDVYANYYSSQERRAGQFDFDIWGVGVVVPIQDFRILGEYWQNTAAPSGVEDTAWNAGIGYGTLDMKKVGSFAVDLIYNDIGAGVYLGGTGLQTDIVNTLKYSDESVARYNEIRYWNLMADVTIMENVYLHGEYAFDAKGRGASGNPSDCWTVSLNYVF